MDNGESRAFDTSDKTPYLKGAFEAMLFAAGDAVELGSMAKVLEISNEEARRVIEILCSDYKSNKNHGIEIIELDGKFQMRTSPVYYECIKALIKLPEKRTLTNTLLETLAIIAYKQPVTKNQIEEIRGLSADHAVNRLLELGFVCEGGRLDSPGRPILFVTTEEFLRRFGISSLSQLPQAFNDLYSKEETDR